MPSRTIPSLIAAIIASLGTAAAATLPPIGLWQGRYDCAQGQTALDLQINARSPTQIDAIFYFHALKSNPDVPQGCFLMHGHYDQATGNFSLAPQNWLARPPFFVAVALSGHVSLDGAHLTGRVSGPACSSFALARSVAPPLPPAPSACRMSQLGPTV